MVLSTFAADSSSRALWSNGQASTSATDGLDWLGQECDTLSWSMSGRWMEATVDKSSAVRRHFAQFERHQLDEVNDEIELGWHCGICHETADDPCVTRCGHLYCRSHLNRWLSKRPSCPVCNSLCTPAQDIVPVFSREQSSLASSNSSPSPTPIHISRSPSPSRLSSLESPTTVKHEGWHHIPSLSGVLGTPFTYNLAYYLGITLRVIGLALLLSVLLPGYVAATSPSPSHPTP